MRPPISVLVVVVSLLVASSAAAGPLDKAECIAAAKPGGGFDLTCKLAQAMLQGAGLVKEPMRVTYIPGGIGAVAYNLVVAQRPGEPNVIVAFSSGSLLNLAQGKFGMYSDADVRWVSAIGADHGAVVVRKGSPFKSLKDLATALKENPNKVVFGGGGAVGSQDWMKAALVARAAGVNHKSMRFVAFEGGGEALTALQGGHIQVFSGDVSEAAQQLEAGAPLEVLAVMADRRLPGGMADVPTAREQGYDITWPIIRGFYVGPEVSDADYEVWVEAFDRAMAAPGFPRLRAEGGLYPFALTGSALDAYVKRSVVEYRKLAEQFGLHVARH